MQSSANETFSWYYVGHYGQLGPLSEEQMLELIRDGVIERGTYVWRTGLTEWIAAEKVPSFQPLLDKYHALTPPPPPMPGAPAGPRIPQQMPGPVQPPASDLGSIPPYGAHQRPSAPQSPMGQPTVQQTTHTPYGAPMHNPVGMPLASQPYGLTNPYLISDKNRTAAGILQLVIPGLGRIYLGYLAQGILQFVLSFCMGLGVVWSWIDGIVMLTGGVKFDGYGRQLKD